MSDAAVVVDSLHVVRRGNEVVPNLSFTLPPGGVTGLLGPSGSGKTTLLRCVLGLQKIQGGTVSVFGLPAGSPALRSRIGYASQAASVYDDLTVIENLRYFARVVSAATDDVERVIEAVDLTAHHGGARWPARRCRMTFSPLAVSAQVPSASFIRRVR